MARRRRTPMDSGDAVNRAVTRRTTPDRSPAADQVRDLEARYGRQGARERLGVSDRTLRRWRAGGTPSRAHQDRLQREASLSPRREKRLRAQGAYVRMTGMIGADSPGKKRRGGATQRHRTIGVGSAIHLTGDQMAEILDRYHQGDEDGALDALREALGEAYYGSITFDDLTQLEFLREPPGGE